MNISPIPTGLLSFPARAQRNTPYFHPSPASIIFAFAIRPRATCSFNVDHSKIRFLEYNKAKRNLLGLQ